MKAVGAGSSFIPGEPIAPGCMQVAELLMGVSAPILYWEQGHEWVFGDPVRNQASAVPLAFQACLQALVSIILKLHLLQVLLLLLPITL